ncbi:hypothetical protein JTE90_000580 [Oedothorax gibbosus]|uniref:Uncharacterized protein n=1 Tax=Oedothorax gibbosus TaxID=931172 RepID=A0AAV6VU81_9ARAC|nr:hypothetical protein JTE90_000580 [Oedothorax gibbosus]
MSSEEDRRMNQLDGPQLIPKNNRLHEDQPDTHGILNSSNVVPPSVSLGITDSSDLVKVTARPRKGNQIQELRAQMSLELTWDDMPRLIR